ncbi:MAG: UDP-4-amino-4,6-dideoxy-N-acetyl-beta-L-altrosamine transaminase [Proteobacteria bacterium]|nr:UDP-4-amino-4,6-dideoxy-N-acetyl-beta-L-altrosamine transaminase [Pseudomonadota bacterium]
MNQAPENFLPYGRQFVEEDDIEAVSAVLRSDWLTTGPLVRQFEESLEETVGCRRAVACSNGTTALHLALLAAGVGAGDAVIVPALTFVATANAVRFAGGEVVFSDVDPESGLMEINQLQEALDQAESRGLHVQAIMPVHLNGQCAEQPQLYDLAKSRGAEIVADACHALGTTYEWPGGKAMVGDGQHSDLATFSFHPVKAIAMGEGGAIVTNDAAMAERMERLRNHGIDRAPASMRNRSAAFDNGVQNPWYYEIHELGFNYRASDIHCALALSQLGKLDRFISKRRNLVRRYCARLESLRLPVRPIARAPGCDPAWHLCAVLIDYETLGATRRQVMERLAASGIGSQVHYVPVHRQPYYRDRYGDLGLPGAEMYYEKVLSLPLFASMEDADVDRVLETLECIMG